MRLSIMMLLQLLLVIFVTRVSCYRDRYEYVAMLVENILESSPDDSSRVWSGEISKKAYIDTISVKCKDGGRPTEVAVDGAACQFDETLSDAEFKGFLCRKIGTGVTVRTKAGSYIALVDVNGERLEREAEKRVLASSSSQATCYPDNSAMPPWILRRLPLDLDLKGNFWMAVVFKKLLAAKWLGVRANAEYSQQEFLQAWTSRKAWSVEPNPATGQVSQKEIQAKFMKEIQKKGQTKWKLFADEQKPSLRFRRAASSRRKKEKKRFFTIPTGPKDLEYTVCVPGKELTPKPIRSVVLKISNPVATDFTVFEVFVDAV